ncbi:MAG: ATP-dependent Clp protease proteolytic subunit [Chitinophagales bacterium]|nr:ATP-dependent Clp protease proteolytic subunit [Chitinophagales bacterium]OJV27248.1 MAG: ATP-dependent Clp protease proteolytic subunit [Bacteroidetes bacterium 37-13]HRN95259.1 ATP-dependent Clp protease proteolytic subunit [Chitinophagales bacterium]HRP39779.1 ATP-dependent Clp protease proteolytic subunit [Chitinophagales bacterium]
MNIKDAKDFTNYAVKHQGINRLGLEKYMKLQSQHTVSNLTRTVIEERPMPFREVDVFSRLMMDRIIFLGTPVDDYVASIIQAQLLFLESSDARSDVQIYINSPGGEVYSGLGIYDTMQYVNMDVATICTGMAASMAAVILCAGEKGKRTALPHARVMIHQPLGGIGGKASDIQISVNEIRKIKDELYAILSSHSGQTLEKIEHDSNRDYWLRAVEAKEYGMIDEVLDRSNRKVND